MEARSSRERRAFAPEYKAEVVELCRTGGKSIGDMAGNLNVSQSVLRRWVKQAAIEAGHRDGLTTAEREEITRLRRENRVLQQERDILKRATVFFAREAQ
jgi:transposase